MKILITGANGMLAQAVRKRLEKGNELICTDVADLDITDEEAVKKFVAETKPEYIVNCAAYTAVDKAETAGEIVEKINADGPGNLAKAAKENNATLVHVSTDYVFGGALDISEVYKENDEKKPVTAYGITKLHGEEQIEDNTDKYYIFRTAWLYGEGNNFVRTMIKLGESKDELNVVADQHGSPTYAVDLAEAIKLCSEENMNISKALGIGLNYIRSMKKEKATKLIEKTNIELENKQRKIKNNITTIAMTQKNWEYLNTFDPKLKYALLVSAGRLCKIYNHKKDQFK